MNTDVTSIIQYRDAIYWLPRKRFTPDPEDQE